MALVRGIQPHQRPTSCMISFRGLSLAAEYADAVRRTLAGRGRPGSAAYFDAANREIGDRPKDARIDTPHAAALVTILMSEALASWGGAG